MRSPAAPLLLVTLLFAGGPWSCYKPDLSGTGGFKCSDGTCPEGYVCSAQKTCVKGSAPPKTDGAAVDGMKRDGAGSDQRAPDRGVGDGAAPPRCTLGATALVTPDYVQGGEPAFGLGYDEPNGQVVVVYGTAGTPAALSMAVTNKGQWQPPIAFGAAAGNFMSVSSNRGSVVVGFQDGANQRNARVFFSATKMFHDLDGAPGSGAFVTLHSAGNKDEVGALYQSQVPSAPGSTTMMPGLKLQVFSRTGQPAPNPSGGQPVPTPAGVKVFGPMAALALEAGATPAAHVAYLGFTGPAPAGGAVYYDLRPMNGNWAGSRRLAVVDKVPLDHQGIGLALRAGHQGLQAAQLVFPVWDDKASNTLLAFQPAAGTAAPVEFPGPTPSQGAQRPTLVTQGQSQVIAYVRGGDGAVVVSGRRSVGDPWEAPLLAHLDPANRAERVALVSGGTAGTTALFEIVYRHREGSRYRLTHRNLRCMTNP